MCLAKAALQPTAGNTSGAPSMNPQARPCGPVSCSTVNPHPIPGKMRPAGSSRATPCTPRAVCSCVDTPSPLNPHLQPCATSYCTPRPLNTRPVARYPTLRASLTRIPRPGTRYPTTSPHSGTPHPTPMRPAPIHNNACNTLTSSLAHTLHTARSGPDHHFRQPIDRSTVQLPAPSNIPPQQSTRIIRRALRSSHPNRVSTCHALLTHTPRPH